MLKINNNQGSIDHTVCIFKIDAKIRPTCACGAASLQTGRLLLKSTGFVR